MPSFSLSSLSIVSLIFFLVCPSFLCRFDSTFNQLSNDCHTFMPIWARAATITEAERKPATSPEASLVAGCVLEPFATLERNPESLLPVYKQALAKVIPHKKKLKEKEKKERRKVARPTRKRRKICQLPQQQQANAAGGRRLKGLTDY